MKKSVFERTELVESYKKQQERIEMMERALRIIAHGKGDEQGISREIGITDINVRAIAKIALNEKLPNHYGIKEAIKVIKGDDDGQQLD